MPYNSKKYVKWFTTQRKKNNECQFTISWFATQSKKTTMGVQLPSLFILGIFCENHPRTLNQRNTLVCNGNCNRPIYSHLNLNQTHTSIKDE